MLNGLFWVRWQYASRSLSRKACAKFGERIVVGIDAKTFTPYDRMRVQHGGMYRQRGRHSPQIRSKTNTSYIDNKKIGTAFEDLGLPNAFYFFAEADEPNHEGSGLNANARHHQVGWFKLRQFV